MKAPATGTAQAGDLAMERDQYMSQLAAAIREATRALAALDIESVDRSTTAQSKLCAQLSIVNVALGACAEFPPASSETSRELSVALRTYKALLRRSTQWVTTSRNTLQLVTGFSESTTSLGHRLSY